MEYCVGGDLLNLLRQDNRLPETSIHDFGRDLLSALLALHSHGVIHCDLKPSNILLDENGRVKLGGFGLARRLTEIQKKAVSSLPQSKRGTPCYMAPELFEDGACHSFASDLWAFGCTLYECAVGHPPFVSSSFTTLVDSILREDVEPVTNCTPEFQDLISGCLQKNPVKRMNWEVSAAHVIILSHVLFTFFLKAIVQHPFWKSNIKMKSLPKQNAFEDFAQKCGYHSGQERNGKENSSHINVAKGNQRNKGGSTVDIVRLSRIANRNLHREGVDYGSCEKAAVDIQLDDADTELDFSEESQFVMAEEGMAKLNTSGSADSTLDALLDEQKDVHLHIEADSRKQSADTRKSAIDRELSSQSLNMGAASEGQSLQSSSLYLEDSVLELSALELAFHSSDLLVKPIVGNRRVEKHHELSWDAAMLPFVPISLAQMLQASQDELEDFLSLIYKSVASSPSLSERLNVLMYFESLCKDSSSANILINSSLMHMFVTKLRTSKTPDLKTHFAMAIGSLVRHATFIGEDVAKVGIIDALTETVRDKNNSVRRKSMAALGELLFYVVTQQQEEGFSGSNSSAWYIPNGTISTICRLLRNTEDAIAQHYAVKTLENIFSIGGEWALRLGSCETALNLVHICSTARSESLKVTASSALARLYRCNPNQSQSMTDKIGVRTLINFLGEGNVKVQQAFASIFVIAIGNASNKMKNALADESTLMDTLVTLLDHGSIVIRGKALLCILQLSKLQVQWFVKGCNIKLISILERLQKVRDEYVLGCMNLLHKDIPLIVSQLLTQITEGIEKLCTRRTSAHGTRTYQNFSRSSLNQSVEMCCLVLLGLVTSNSFRMSCANAQTIESLTLWMEKFQKGSPDNVKTIKDTVFNILEAISQHGDILLHNANKILTSLVPALTVSMTHSQSGDMRFLCAKLLCDITLLFISEFYTEEGLSEGLDTGVEMGRDLLQKQVSDYLLPNVPVLLNDEDPIPLYALKMLVAVLDFFPSLTCKVADLELVPEFFSYLSLDHANNNVHNLRLCKAMVVSSHVPIETLMQLDFVHKASDVLCYTCDNMVDAFIEPALELCAAIIRKVVEEGGEDVRRCLSKMHPCIHLFESLSKHADLSVAELSQGCMHALSQLEIH